MPTSSSHLLRRIGFLPPLSLPEESRENARPAHSSRWMAAENPASQAAAPESSVSRQPGDSLRVGLLCYASRERHQSLGILLFAQAKAKRDDGRQVLIDRVGHGDPCILRIDVDDFGIAGDGAGPLDIQVRFLHRVGECQGPKDQEPGPLEGRSQEGRREREKPECRSDSRPTLRPPQSSGLNRRSPRRKGVRS